MKLLIFLTIIYPIFASNSTETLAEDLLTQLKTLIKSQKRLDLTNLFHENFKFADCAREMSRQEFVTFLIDENGGDAISVLHSKPTLSGLQIVAFWRKFLMVNLQTAKIFRVDKSFRHVFIYGKTEGDCYVDF
ncbi:unnamed protein product [Caenorhabditis angaria]|uniref:NTF2-like domain-containing protein n=1 Tax=Caenorhabditis angaria TaxID=860376 RepID=A0A9P1I881_9PELO|nr:unnamed protein product [Caenorhabditis angaria]